MNSPRLPQALAVIACALMVPVAAAAATPAAAPVTVSKCESAPHPFDPSTGYVTATQADQGALVPDAYGHDFPKTSKGANPVLGIDFTNTTNKAISLVDFAYIGDGKMVTEVRDVGSFGPGIEIKHEFMIALEKFPTLSQRCVPLQVRFVDGTMWKNPELP